MEEFVVVDNFIGFQELYHPVLHDTFKDVFEFQDGKFRIDSNDIASKKFLAMHINDNVYKNLQHNISIALFDPELKFGKDTYSTKKKEVIVRKLLEDKDFV